MRTLSDEDLDSIEKRIKGHVDIPLTSMGEKIIYHLISAVGYIIAGVAASWVLQELIRDAIYG